MNERQRLDPTTFAVLKARLDHIAWTIRDVMLMASRSTILTVVQDYSTGIFDREGNVLLLPDMLPVQMCEAAPAVQACVEAYKGDTEPGDVILNNSPYHGNAHIAEINMVCPVFYQGELLFWCMDRPHYNDIGCYLPTSINAMAKDVWEEGLHIPPIRVARNHKLDEHFLDLLCANIRYPKMFKGDFLACLGSIWRGEEMLMELCKKYGLETVKQFIEEYQDYGDRRMTEEIKKLPKGSWYGEEKIDPFPGCPPEGATLRVKMTIDPDEASITFDMTGCDDQVPCAINATWASSRGGCLDGLLACLDPSMPRNWGAYKHVKFITRKGSICDPEWPAATAVATTVVPDRLANLVMKLFCQFAPERGHAGCGIEGASVPYLIGKDWRRNAEPYGGIPFIANAGGPASMGYDGWPGFFSAAAMGAMLNEATELHELRYPHICWEVLFPSDSGGAGKWIGGPGIRFKIQPRHTDMQIIPFGDGLRYPPGGVLGGGEGMVCQHKIIDVKAGKTVQDLGNAGDYLCREGQLWEGSACGGGGFGDPLERDPEKVRWDVREEFVSLKAARDIFGVVLNTKAETYEVDYEATRKLRDKLKKEKAREKKREQERR